MPEVTIEHPDGSTDTVPYTVGWEEQTELNKMRRLLIDVNREELAGVTLQRKRDEVVLDGVGRHQLVDVQSGSSSHTLVCYSAEWLDTREPYLPGGAVREGSDAGIVTDLVNSVAAWTLGTTSEFATGLSFVFNHSAYGGALRTVERNVPGEIRFRDFGTVDYVDALGSDKTGSVTLSEDAGTIEQAIQITERGRTLDGTHVRILGAHEGEAQIFANLVPEGDPATYENEVRYTTPRWNGPADTDWTRWSNKDVTDQATAYTEAESLAEEVGREYVEAETTVPASVGLEVGDWVRVVKDDADLDREMRVHRRTRQGGGRNDAEGNAAVLDKVVLSTRTTVRRDDSDDAVVRQQFQSGYQGSSVAINPGPFGRAVDSGSPLEFNFRYPDLAYENLAQLQITGREYRIDSVGAASGGGTTATSADNSDFQSVVDSSQSSGDTAWLGQPLPQTDLVSATPTQPTSYVLAFADVSLKQLDVNDAQFDVWVDVNGARYPDGGVVADVQPDDSFGVVAAIPEDLNGDQVAVKVEERSNSGQGTIAYQSAIQAAGKHTHTVTVPEHAHPPDPGIYTTPDTPSGVDVAVNGTEVATDIGSGTFETVVDVGDEFSRDDWNSVSVSSDALGIIEVSAYIEGYAKVGGRN